jgi:outer membrane receptor protein involved in Fe transport
MAGYRNRSSGLSAEVRNRWVRGFPANSGVYIGDVPGYTLLDATVSIRPSIFPKAMISVGGTNLLDDKHQEFIGGGTIGRLIMTRLQYTF